MTTMTLEALHKAHNASEKLKRMRSHHDALKNQRVRGIFVGGADKPITQCTPISPGTGGGGTINSIHFSEELEAHMTDALQEFFANEMKRLIVELEGYGVKVVL